MLTGLMDRDFPVVTLAESNSALPWKRCSVCITNINKIYIKYTWSNPSIQQSPEQAMSTASVEINIQSDTQYIIMILRRLLKVSFLLAPPLWCYNGAISFINLKTKL